MRSITSSRRPASVAVVGIDKKGMGLLRECLRTEAVLPNSAYEFDEAMDLIRRQRPNVVIASFSGDYQQAIRLGVEVAAEFPQQTMVAYSEAGDPERIRAAMRAGFRDFVVLPDDSELLRQVVHDAAYAPTTDESTGEVVAICGSKGGSGVTSLCINLAAELCPVHRVAVLDMDFSVGDVASYLDLKPNRNITDVLKDLNRLDERVLAGSMAVHTSKVHVLAQPNELDESMARLRGDDVLRLLQVCADSYQYCLVDCGSHVDEGTTTVLSVADLILLVTNPDVPSVKNAFRRLRMFERMGVEQDRIRLIVNKVDKRAPVSLKDIEGNLGLKVAATVDLDEKTLSQAINEGRLVRDVNRRSPAARDYSGMVTLITEGDAFIEPKEKKDKSGISWLFN